MVYRTGTKEFMDLATNVMSLPTAEEQDAYLDAMKVNKEEFYKTYDTEFFPKVKEKLAGYEGEIVDADSARDFVNTFEDDFKTGSWGGRIVGRILGDLGQGVVNVGDMVIDALPGGEEFTDKVAQKVDKYVDEYIPEYIRQTAAETFDPFHGYGVQSMLEEGGAGVVSFLIPAGALAKGITYSGKIAMATNTAQKITPTVVKTANALKKKALSGLDPKHAAIATKLGKTAAAGTAASVPFIATGTPFSGDIRRNAYEAGIDVDNKTDNELLTELYKENIMWDAAIGLGLGAAVGIGKGTVKAGQQLVNNNPALQNIINPFTDNSVTRFAKNWFTGSRGTDDKTLSMAIKRDAAAEAASDKAAGFMQDLQRQLKSAGALDLEETVVNDALNGNRKALRKLARTAPEAARIVIRARANIDKLSQKLRNDTINNKGIQAVIDKNTGAYVNRSYMAFEDEAYRKDLVKRIGKANVNDTEVINALNLIKRTSKGNISDNEAKERLRTLLKASDTDEALRTFNAMQNVPVESRVFKKRQNLPKALKQFYGEIKNPYSNYTNTMKKLSVMDAESQFTKELKDHFAANNLIRQVGDENTVNIGEVMDQRLARVFGGSDKVTNALDGIYVDKAYADIVQNGLDQSLDTSTPMGKAISWWARAKGMSQAAKTIYNPATHVKNVVGQGIFLAANGMLPVRKGAGKDVFNIAKQNILNMSDEQLGKEFGRLRELGVVNSGVAVSMIRKNMQELANNPDSYMKQSLARRAIGNPLQRFNKTLTDVYQAEDDIFKVLHYKNSFDTLKKAYPNMGQQQLEEMAAQRTRDLMPNYNQVSKAVAGLRRMPVGDFLTFPIETMRVSKNLAKYTLQDWASGNPVLQKAAAARLAGMTVVGTAPALLNNMTRNEHGITPEQEDSLNILAAPYEAFSDRVYLSGVNVDKNGHKGIDYINIGAWDPFDYLKSFGGAAHQIINSLDVGDKVDNDWIANRPEFNHAMTSILDNQLGPILGPSMLTDALIKVAGGDINNPIAAADASAAMLRDAGLSNGLATAIATIADPFTPPMVNWLNRRREYEQSGMTSKGSSTITEDQASLKGMFGMGTRRLDLTAGFNFRTGQFMSDNNKALQTMSKDLANPNASADDVMERWREGNRKRQRSQLELSTVLNAYRDLGMDDRDIVDAMSMRKAPGKTKDMNLFYMLQDNMFVPDALTRDQMIQLQQKGGVDWDRYGKELGALYTQPLDRPYSQEEIEEIIGQKPQN